MPVLAPQSPPLFVQLLAHDLRWTLVRALAEGDRRVQELVEQVHQPMNLVSYHLKQLRAGGLVSARRSDADGRDVYYSLELGRLKTLHEAAGMALHPALGQEPWTIKPDALTRMRVLFVCTYNSARSQMAEGLLRSLTGGMVDVLSAGSHPRSIHPQAVLTMERLGVDIRSQRSRPLSDFENQAFDYVITVCDHAREVCPVFPGEGWHLHWSFADPAAVEDEGTRAAAFSEVADRLKERIGYFLLMRAPG